MNEHVEHFKRWSDCYLMWSHSNMDRIARETYKKHLAAQLEEREISKRKESPLYKYMEMMNVAIEEMNRASIEQLKQDNIFLTGTHWRASQFKNIPIRIKVPEPEPEPSRFRRVFSALTPLFERPFR